MIENLQVSKATIRASIIRVCAQEITKPYIRASDSRISSNWHKRSIASTLESDSSLISVDLIKPKVLTSSKTKKDVINCPINLIKY